MITNAAPLTQENIIVIIITDVFLYEHLIAADSEKHMLVSLLLDAHLQT